jgi:hypothetical protein
LVAAGIVPLPIAPLVAPVTAKAVEELNTTVMVWAIAASVSSMALIEELAGFELVAEARAELPPGDSRRRCSSLRGHPVPQ